MRIRSVIFMRQILSTNVPAIHVKITERVSMASRATHAPAFLDTQDHRANQVGLHNLFIMFVEMCDILLK